MGHRQKGKNRKRRKSWHRGAKEARRWAAARLPDVQSGADPCAGQPAPLSNAKGRKNRGDAA